MAVQLDGSVSLTSELSPGDVAAMFALFQEHFEGASFSIFERDLRQKQHVILLREGGTTAVQGFTSLQHYTTHFQGQEIGVLYSGDTIIRPAFWGTTVLPRLWIKTALEIGETLPKPLYWLLLSSGYKTYRFLTVFYKTFYPRYDDQNTTQLRALRDQLALARFGDQYDAKQGVVRFHVGATPLQADVADIDEKRLKDPHVSFFAQQNPGHTAGDELVCLTKIAVSNLTAAGKRMLR